MIGQAEDNISILISAIKYLQDNQFSNNLIQFPDKNIIQSIQTVSTAQI
jgi:hypothetical protein